MKVWSWNINGLRAALRKGFEAWLTDVSGAEIVALQEIRARREQLPVRHRTPPEGWTMTLNPAERAGYSGVGLYSRRAPERVETSLGVSEFDAEGRVQLADWGALRIANVYFPNGSGRDRDKSRVPFKLAFYRRLFDVLKPDLDAGRRLLVVGDFNTAHRPIDLARPRENTQTSGFLDIERAELDRWLEAGWVDTFRHLHPEREGVYSWWSQRRGVRARNVGWRIDYVLASPAAMAFVRDAMVATEVMGSDHCPVGVALDPAILDDAT